ncbi:MAG: hypothetical protein AT710_06220 [Thermocladium sp. ECH_B]|nr:MAG: hypothetical protein AT710_06220 [Thermocladium sp. ECH_B]
MLRGLVSFPDQSLGGGGRLPTIPREGVAPMNGGVTLKTSGNPHPKGGEEVSSRFTTYVI